MWADRRAKKQELKDEINIVLELAIQFRTSPALEPPNVKVAQFKRIQTLATKLASAVRKYEVDLAMETDLSYEAVAAAVATADKINRWAKAAEARELQRKGAAPKSDQMRILMIVALSDVFTEILDQPATATDGGAWCLFLAEVLRRCERTSLSDRRAYELWLMARDEYDIADEVKSAGSTGLG